MTPVALGFRAKTGRAIAVALTWQGEAPQIEWRGEVALVDPTIPQTAQPYHAVMDLPWPESAHAAMPFIEAIEAVAARELSALRDHLRSRHLRLHGVGVVGSADRDLAKIGNPHIRAHAAEGIAFRRVLESAAASLRISSRSFADKTLFASAPAQLGLSPRALDARLKVLGRAAGPPWRADERAAAAAAWIALAGMRR